MIQTTRGTESTGKVVKTEYFLLVNVDNFDSVMESMFVQIVLLQVICSTDNISYTMQFLRIPGDIHRLVLVLVLEYQHQEVNVTWYP